MHQPPSTTSGIPARPLDRLRRRPVAFVLALLALVLAGQAALVTGAGAAGAAGATKWYVALGDSYAVGYQPGIGATSGYTGYVAAHEHLRLANFGCAGATTTSILDTVGCHVLAAGSGAVPSPAATQEAAATAFITAHRGRIGLITVSIGGNDVTDCAAAANPVTCVAGAIPAVNANVTTLAGDLRSAAGPGVRIIGLTYPDVILGQWVHPPVSIALATASVSAFQSLVNPNLKSAYAKAGATFIDVTAATGAYVPLTTTVLLPPYGRIPAAVASVCRLSYYCTQGNIHLHTSGYTLMGRLITAAVAKKK